MSLVPQPSSEDRERDLESDYLAYQHRLTFPYELWRAAIRRALAAEHHCRQADEAFAKWNATLEDKIDRLTAQPEKPLLEKSSEADSQSGHH